MKRWKSRLANEFQLCLSNIPEWILTFLCSAPTSALLQHKENDSKH